MLWDATDKNVARILSNGRAIRRRCAWDSCCLLLVCCCGQRQCRSNDPLHVQNAIACRNVTVEDWWICAAGLCALLLHDTTVWCLCRSACTSRPIRNSAPVCVRIYAFWVRFEDAGKCDT